MAESGIRIRLANVNDIPGVIELWKEHLDYHARCNPYFERAAGAEAGFGEYLTENLANIGLFVAETGTRLVGFTLLEMPTRPPCFVNRTYGMITDLAVTEEFRHRTIGQQLLKQALSWFKARDIHRIETSMLDVNPLSTAFWKSAGFKCYLSRAYILIE